MEVRLIDVLGDDLRVVNSARVSFGKESEWDIETIERDCLLEKDMTGKPFREKVEIKTLSEKDQKLISYLAKHNHWTPFSHVQITMVEKLPIFVARQRFKHTVGFSYSEVSRRYVDDTPEFYTPDSWRKRADNKKQGSSETEVIEKEYNWIDNDIKDRSDCGKESSISRDYDWFVKTCGLFYQTLIDSGVAPEQARMVLPQSMYTEVYATGSLAAWARAYKLRSDPHSQKEIRDLADMWNKTISNLPQLKYSWSALIETT